MLLANIRVSKSIKVLKNYINSDLLHRIALSQRDCVRLFERVEIDCDGKRDSDFVGSSVSSTNRA